MSKRKPLSGMYTAEQAAERIVTVLGKPEKKWAYYKTIISLAREDKFKYKMSGKSNNYWNFDMDDIENYAKQELEMQNNQMTIWEELLSDPDPFGDINIKEEQAEYEKLKDSAAKLFKIQELLKFNEEMGVSPEIRLTILKEVVSKI